MNKAAEKYESDFLSEIFSEISPQEQEKTNKRMLLAAKIDDAMKAKGWKKGDLAREMNKQPSIITRWLSGTHNFESDTLFDIERVLNIGLVSLNESPKELIVKYYGVVSEKVLTTECSPYCGFLVGKSIIDFYQGSKSRHYAVSSHN